MIRTILFDLDGTLLDRESSIRQFVTSQHQRMSASLSHIAEADYVKRWVELDCHGHVWKDKVYQQLVSEFSIEGIGWQELLQDYETQFMYHCVPFPGLTDILTLLKQHNYSLGIITNGLGEFQSRAVQGLGVQSFFDAILISEVEGVRKPQSEIFNRALHKLDAIAGETVFVGDNPEVDVNGAKGAGLKVIWKRNSVWLEPTNADAAIDDLHEIPALIEGL